MISLTVIGWHLIFDDNYCDHYDDCEDYDDFEDFDDDLNDDYCDDPHVD